MASGENIAISCSPARMKSIARALAGLFRPFSSHSANRHYHAASVVSGRCRYHRGAPFFITIAGNTERLQLSGIGIRSTEITRAGGFVRAPVRICFQLHDVARQIERRFPLNSSVPVTWLRRLPDAALVHASSPAPAQCRYLPFGQQAGRTHAGATAYAARRGFSRQIPDR